MRSFMKGEGKKNHDKAWKFNKYLYPGSGFQLDIAKWFNKESQHVYADSQGSVLQSSIAADLARKPQQSLTTACLLHTCLPLLYRV